MYYTKGEEFLQRALAIQERTLGTDHPDTAQSCNNLGGLYAHLEEYTKAKPLLERALAIREQKLGTEHPDIADSLTSLAWVYYVMGDFAKSEFFYQRALAICEQVLGIEHLDTVQSLDNLAKFSAIQGKFQEAYPLFIRAREATEYLLEQVFSFTSQSQQQAFLATQKSSLHVFLSFISQHFIEKSSARRDGFNIWLRRKSMLLETQQRFQEALVRSDNSEVKATWQALTQVRQQLWQLTFNRTRLLNDEDYQQRLDDLNAEQEELEATLSRLSEPYAASRKTAEATVGQLAGILPNNTALIDFAAIPFYDFAANDRQPAHYLAFLLHAENAENVRLIDLGEAQRIDDAVTNFRSLLGNKNTQVSSEVLTSAEELYHLIFAPLQKELGDVKEIFLSPDGNLNLLPFEVLRNPQGEFLLEEYQFNYLAASRDLVGFGQPAESGQPPVLMGDPDFDLENSPSLDEKQSGPVLSQDENSDLRGMSFTRLPETRKEVEAIAALFTPQSEVYVGEQAREETLMDVNAPRVLHLATHGFFLEDRPLPEIELGPVQFDTTMQLDMAGRSVWRMPGPGFQFQNPLQRSGIALAGANHTDRDGNAAGLVTADKILDLRLRGTDLVVLSACETGLGNVQTGEGVYGLRRAFLQVGAKSLVMSLWNVPDRETKELMVRFYENLNSGKMNRTQALRKAILHQKQVTEERYGAPHPLYWSAFVFLGEP